MLLEYFGHLPGSGEMQRITSMLIGDFWQHSSSYEVLLYQTKLLSDFEPCKAASAASVSHGRYCDGCFMVVDNRSNVSIVDSYR